MPIQLLRFSQLDLAAWDACVAAARPVVPYMQSWWLLATAGRWDAAVETGEGGRYLSILPLPTKRRPWGREVYQPAFTQQLGLLTTAASRHRDLLDYLPLLTGRYVRFYTQLHTGHELVAAPPGFAHTERLTYQLGLAPDYPTLLAGYTADYRRRLRLNQALPQPLIVTRTTSVADLLALFQQHKGGEVAGLKEKHYQQLTQLHEALQLHAQALVLEVREPGTRRLLAGALFVQQPQLLVYLFAAASPEGKKAGAPLLILDWVIRHQAGTPGLVLDFEGGMIPSIARFFANFGATPVPYAALSFTQRPWYLQWLR